MDRDCFLLTDAQFARIEPHLPTDTRGKPRVDDRRVIGGYSNRAAGMKPGEVEAYWR
jgi:transposase